MNTQICFAIKSRVIIQINYDGGIRIIEPYCHGISQAGNEVLRAYQIRGFSRSGEPSGWKLFESTKIHNIIITSDNFKENRVGYNPNDQGMNSIHCHV
jgi:hypothetical protein